MTLSGVEAAVIEATSACLGRGEAAPRQLRVVDLGTHGRLASGPDAVATRADIGMARGLQRAGAIVVVAHPEELPFRRASFTAAAIAGSLERSEDGWVVIAEAARVLMPAGRAVVAAQNRHDMFVVVHKLADRLSGTGRPASAYFSSPDNRVEYTWTDFELAVNSSLRIIDRIPVGWPATARPRALANRLIALGPFRWLSHAMIVIAERR